MKTVIIAQKHLHVIDEIKELFGEKSRKIIFTNSISEAFENIPGNGMPYLLITGAIFEGERGGSYLCRSARNKNPNGKIILLTTMVKDAELFDDIIDKYTQSETVWHKQLRNVVDMEIRG
jgi:DNA-binding NarL/FixJ family response regulator